MRKNSNNNVIYHRGHDIILCVIVYSFIGLIILVIAFYVQEPYKHNQVHFEFTGTYGTIAKNNVKIEKYKSYCDANIILPEY